MYRYRKLFPYSIISVISTVIKSFVSFFTLMLFYFMLGNINTHTIALILLCFAGCIFAAAFVSAKIKDSAQKRRVSQQTVFESR